MRSTWVHYILVLALIGAPLCPGETPSTSDKEANPTTSELPGTGSLEKFIEIQEFIEASKDPDWLMTIGGVALALLAAQRLIRNLIGETPQQVVPAIVRLGRVNRAMRLGEETQKEVGELIPRLMESSVKAKEAAEALQLHFKNVPPKMPHRQRIKTGTVAEMDAILADEFVRKEIEANPRGNKWLKRYLEIKGEYSVLMRDLVKTYNQGATSLRRFSDHTNSLAEGVFMIDSLRHKPTEFEARVADEKAPGETHLSLNSGYTREVTDPAALARELHGPRTTCRDIFSKLQLEKTRSRMTLLRQGLLRPAADVGLVGVGLGLYAWGAKRIQDMHDANPQQLVEQARAREQLEAVQSANRLQELSSVIETLKTARTEGKDAAKVARLYEVLRTVLRKHLDAVAEDVRFHTSRVSREAAGFNEALEKFRTDDAFANTVIDAALAEAAASELRATDINGLQKVLIPDQPNAEPLRERLLMKNFAFSAKYLWPRLTIEANAQPVQASTVANIVKEAIPMLDAINTPAVPPKQEKRQPDHNPPGEPSAAAVPGPTFIDLAQKKDSSLADATP